MENKTGNIKIIAGENMAFNSEEIFFNSFSEIENQSSHVIVKNGEENGRLSGNYTELVLEDNNVKVKEYLYLDSNTKEN